MMDKFTSNVSTLVSVVFSLLLLIACGGNGSKAVKVPDAPITPQFDLTINIAGAGSVYVEETNQTCTTSCTISAQANSALTLTAKAVDDTQQFQGWTNCGSDDTCTINLTRNTTVSATFDVIPLGEFYIDIIGQGTVSSSSLQSNCETFCSYIQPIGQSIQLQATPNDNMTLVGWSDNCDVTDNGCEIIVSQGLEVTAYFEPITIQAGISLTVSGSGSVLISELDVRCSGSCSYTVPQGTQLTFIAEPDPDNTIASWGNLCSGNPTSCTTTINSDTSISVNFEPQITEATLALTVQGSGTINVNQSTFQCNTNCSYTFPLGTEITLNAVPQEGSIFLNYQSDVCTGDNTTCTFVIDQDSNVTATFENTQSLTSNNAILIKEPLGESRTNHPVQIGRLFVKGEITSIPKLTYKNQVLDTQVDVKQRYSDGSLKHAILSFILPSIAAYEEAIISFEDEGESDNTPLTKSQIQNQNVAAKMHFDFGADKQVTVSAQHLINQDLYTPWLSGSINTTIIVADHSLNRQFDIGADDNKSLRPSFVISFWPTIGQYFVRYVVENTNTEVLQDQVYNVNLSIGDQDQVFYSATDVPHQTMTRWTKAAWSSETPQPLSINHNLKYLTRIPSIPNFDTNLAIPESAINQEWNKWLSRSKDIYERGFWDPRMGNAGGRPDIGIYPSWAIKWLFSGDWRHQAIALASAELSGAWPIHLREGDENRYFDFDNQISGEGKILSIAPGGRPSHWTDRPDWHEVKENDKIIPLTPFVKTEWRPDTSHHPDLATIQYLFTGDYYFLEQMMFSAAFVTGNNNARAFDKPIGRGPTGSEGALYYLEARTQAWALRTRVHTYDLLPDDFPEKAYFHRLNQNAITMYEGMYHLPITSPERLELYNFVKDNVSTAKFARSGGPSPLGFWDEGISSSGYVNEVIFHTDGLYSAIAPWMQNFMIVALGRAHEIGYDTTTLRSFAGQHITAPFSIDGIDHDMLTAYATPVLDSNQNWFATWQDVHSHYKDSYKELIKQRLTTGTDTEHGYYSILMAATSYLQHMQGYDKAWKYVEDNIKSKTIYHSNPKWAILPRESNNP